VGRQEQQRHPLAHRRRPRVQRRRGRVADGLASKPALTLTAGTGPPVTSHLRHPNDERPRFRLCAGPGPGPFRDGHRRKSIKELLRLWVLAHRLLAVFECSKTVVLHFGTRWLSPRFSPASRPARIAAAHAPSSQPLGNVGPAATPTRCPNGSGESRLLARLSYRTAWHLMRLQQGVRRAAAALALSPIRYTAQSLAPTC
jgi:hypothetical protein